MLIKKVNVCPCYVKLDNYFFYKFLVPGSIEYFKRDSKPIVFKDRYYLLQHLKIDTRPEEYSTINRFQQIFYIWFSLCEYCSIFISQNGINFSPISTSSINKIIVEEDFSKH